MQNGDARRDLYVYNGGLITGRRIRRILQLSGWDVRLGLPGPEDWVGVWGQSPTALRGEAVARTKDAPILRVEDAFVRSVLLGRSGEAPLGLLLDQTGLHFDASRPSDIETLLAREPLDDTALLDAARHAMERMAYWQISKYNAFDPDIDLPQAPYVLVIDQTAGDAAVTASGADRDMFVNMLVEAQANHPGLPLLIKTHPETAAGHRYGHFRNEDETELVRLYDAPVAPYALMQGAVAVYTVSSQIGFEAIFAGHRPRVYGTPFYAGWGLTDDQQTFPRRTRNLTRAQLFAGAMVLYPRWYDPYRDALASVDQVIDTLAARARACAEDHKGYAATGISRWKRRHMRSFFGQYGRLRFAAAPKQKERAMTWGNKPGPDGAIRVEDGVLRSRGLGAALIPPLSLIRDDLGLYYDPSRASRMEALIARSPKLPTAERNRAEALVARITGAGLSKYNLDKPLAQDLPEGHRILVPGQVEDDGSILLGCTDIRTNKALLEETRRRNPDAVLVFKPHPDVVAGLRRGGNPAEIAALADLVLEDCDPAQAIMECAEVWTMTSTLGFEALLRGKPVTCFGTPFYAGWGLTRDLGPAQLRRQARPDTMALAHAVLIGAARYHDPVTDTPCPVEVAVDRLLSEDHQPTPRTRLMSTLNKLVIRRRD